MSVDASTDPPQSQTTSAPAVDPAMRRRAIGVVSAGLVHQVDQFDRVRGGRGDRPQRPVLPETSIPFMGILLSFSTYAIGFAARPIGGVIFAHFGDRIGRKKMLMMTLGLMGFGTFMIGCLPNFAAIGIAAPIILVLLRIVQGLGVGGEWGGAALMATEYAPAKRRGFFGSWPQIGVPAGTLLANGAFFLVVGLLITDEAFEAWGWRIPFLSSLALIALSFYIRSKVAESPVFEEIKGQG